MQRFIVTLAFVPALAACRATSELPYKEVQICLASPSQVEHFRIDLIARAKASRVQVSDRSAEAAHEMGGTETQVGPAGSVEMYLKKNGSRIIITTMDTARFMPVVGYFTPSGDRIMEKWFVRGLPKESLIRNVGQISERGTWAECPHSS